jgi:sugar lactone lactonase YvrE
MSATADLVLDLKNDLGEGAIWNPMTQNLCFIDITGRRVYDYDPANGLLHSFATPEMVGTVVPRRRGGLVLSIERGMAAADPRNGEIRLLAAPAEHDPLRCRFNDGKCDPQGRFWAGTMSLTSEPNAGALYCFDSRHTSRRVLTEVSVSNGLAWSLDGKTFYYIDSPTRRVDAFSFDPDSGELSGRRCVIALPPGEDMPDGCTIDSEGKLWIAHWDGGRVSRWDPDTGREIGSVAVPAPRVTSCAFGGDRLETLYITSARVGMTAEGLARAPLSGGLFSCSPGVAGMPAFCYAG